MYHIVPTSVRCPWVGIVAYWYLFAGRISAVSARSWTALVWTPMGQEEVGLDQGRAVHWSLPFSVAYPVNVKRDADMGQRGVLYANERNLECRSGTEKRVVGGKLSWLI